MNWGGNMDRTGQAGHAATEHSRSRVRGDREDKVRENRLRRTAQRRGYRLMKSRGRDTAAPGYGGYMLIAAFGNLVMLGADPYSFSATLEDVEDYLNQADAGDHPDAAHVPVRNH
jgi:hypothetical protein